MKNRVPIGVIVRATGKEPWAALHLCRDIEEARHLSTLTSNGAVDMSTAHQTTVCTLNVPASLSTPEFLAIVAPVHSRVHYYRFIRAVSPETFMVVIKFADVRAVEDYQEQYEGRPFNASESARCQIVRIGSMIVSPLLSLPFASGDVQKNGAIVNSQEATKSLKKLPHEEDQQCPVCLEKMDENLTPLLTTLCQHTFHVNCLSKWGDGSCPVCRYSQRTRPAEAERSGFKSQLADTDDDEEDDNACTMCASTDDLSVCLICGHVGCGPRQQAHAYAHYMSTDHIYALEMDTQRAWDFAGNGYVHRLIQNAVDGKLVELPGPSGDGASSSPHANAEKMDEMALEYSYLLTSQLDSQRAYYEDRIETLTTQVSELMSSVDDILSKTKAGHVARDGLQNQMSRLERDILETRKEKAKLKRQWTTLTDKYKQTQHALEEETAMALSLMKNKDLLEADIANQEEEKSKMNNKVEELMLALGNA